MIARERKTFRAFLMEKVIKMMTFFVLQKLFGLISSKSILFFAQ